MGGLVAGRGGGGRRLGGGRAVAALGHELVELGAVLGRAQLVEIVAELALLLIELAQRLLAVFVEGDVARRVTVSPALALPGAPLFTLGAPVRARGIAVFGGIP